MAEQKYVSMDPDAARESSGLPSDFDGTWSGFKFTKEAPDNYAAEGNPIFAVVEILQDGDAPAEERTITQSYGLGGKAGDEFTITEDGFALIPTGEESTIRGGSKWHSFLKCAKEQGLAPAILNSGHFKAALGTRAHWKRIDDAKLLGKERDFQDDKRKKSKFPPQTLVITKILTGASVATTHTAAPAGNTNEAAAGSGDLDTDTSLVLLEVLGGAKDKTVQRSQLTLLLSKAAMKMPNRQEIAKRGSDEKFLLGLVEQGFIKYDPAAKPQVVTAV